MTGVSPAGLLSGGSAVFEALIERAADRRRSAYEVPELLASLLEVSHALLRVTLKASGGTQIPPALQVTRPGGRPVSPPAPKRISARDLARQMEGGEIRWQPR